MMDLPIYLDYNSTTPVDPAVLDEMMPYFNRKFGNAASKTHSFGWVAAETVDKARERVAALVGAEPNEIIFTSGSTEGINLALKGAFEAYRSKGNHIITAATEHKAVLDTCKKLEKQGADITYLPVNIEGRIDLQELEKSIKDSTIMVCIMYGNNEIGVIQPVREIAAIAHSKKTLFFSDATQAIGKTKVNVQDDGIDILVMSAHKIYGPKGAGALYKRRRNPRVNLIAQIDGGGHENNFRSGTLNVPGIVGLGKAAELCMEKMETDISQIRALRDRLESELLKIGEVNVNGGREHRLMNTSNLSFHHVDSNVLMKKLSDKIAVSSGSACTSAIPEPSYVLKALGMDDERAYSSVRFSLGRFTTEEEIDYAVKRLAEAVNELRGVQ